jgi:H+/gluconate symporter-like permease
MLADLSSLLGSVWFAVALALAGAIFAFGWAKGWWLKKKD